MQRVPVEIVIVPHLWPARTVERVSKRRTIYWSALWLPINVRYLSHSLAHVQQRERLGWRYAFAYAWYWLLARGRHSHHRMENEARDAEHEDFYRSWAADLIRERESWEAA